MRYVEARLDACQREEAYRNYVTKSLTLIPQNKWLTKSYAETLVPQKVDNRTGAEIVADIVKSAGLKFG